MRDALRAVLAVIGVAALFIGSIGLFRGELTRVEKGAGGCGLLLLAVVALTPAGKPRPPVYEDWDQGRRGG